MYKGHFKPRSGGGKPSFGSRKPFSRGGRPARFSHAAARSGFIDVSKFINKAVITEEVERFVPEHKFADFALDERLKKNIITKGYSDPTPIQDRSIPHVLRGQDVVGIANTGTGKTAAFLIPLINKALTDRTQRVLVMVPTRELAQQIAQELKEFTPGLQIFSAVCVGGAGIGPQMSDLRRKPQFVIGTPGRLKDLLERKALVLSGFQTAVLDEADRMLDMGFINDMRKILSLLPNPRHTLFFSATLSPEIEKLIGAFLHEPVRVSVKTRDTSATIDQDVVRVPVGANKIDILHDLLIKPEFNKVLVFGRTKHGVEKLSKTLVQRGIRSESIHGNKTQGKRQKALDLFKRDHVQVLVATDVAARGLDISGVSHVINYDLPASHEDYIHRIGRTGRAGKKGMALTFIDAK
ncbi:MAG TPA: DEAD/DEAH box helicase [Candidatus Paceibacterota bacterium]|nr:DEAD/DEAH box helicase [Candidatus Paceibacterota bacterium]